MKTYSAIEVRKRFGQILDEAAAGERIVIERAGQPVAGLVPLADLAAHDPERRRQARLEALARLQGRAARDRARLGPLKEEVATMIRRTREERTEEIVRAARERRRGEDR